MIIYHEIEYQAENGDYVCFEVELEADVHIENDGIGPYEYWGEKCFDKGHDYIVVEGVTWDETKHTEQENNIIRNHIADQRNMEYIEQKFATQYGEDMP